MRRNTRFSSMHSARTMLCLVQTINCGRSPPSNNIHGIIIRERLGRNNVSRTRYLRRTLLFLGLGLLVLVPYHVEAFGIVSSSSRINSVTAETSLYRSFPVCFMASVEYGSSTSSSDFPANFSKENHWEHDDEQQHKGERDETYWTNLKISKLANKSPYNASAAVAANQLLDEMENPDSVTYNGVLKAHAKSPSRDSAWYAEQLLDEMERVNEHQVLQNRLWYEKRSLGDLTQEQLEEGPPPITVKPNVRSYSTVMDAWSRGKDLESAERANDLLLRMEELYKQTGDEGCRPNEVSYNTVIAAWAKSGEGEDAARRAQELLQSMRERNLDDVISYNAVMLAWARSGVPNAGEHAEALLRNMTYIRPNTRTYTTAIDAWSRSNHEDSVHHAHALLKEMEQVYEETGDELVRPNCVSYSAVINAYAHSKETRKAAMACELLEHMKELYDSGKNTAAQPSLVTYNSVLNACATTTRGAVEKDDGIDLKHIVRSIYRDLTDPQQKLRPDHFTYGTVLKACANLFCGEPDNPDFVKEVFEKCCANGQVSFGVCYQLRQAAPSELYRSLIPREAYNSKNGHFSLKDMPREWTRNVRDSRRPKRYKN